MVLVNGISQSRSGLLILWQLNQMPDVLVTELKEVPRQTSLMSDVMSIAIAGMNASSERFAASANRVVENRDGDLAAELVQQKFAAIELKANIAVLKTADKMTKNALDILA